MSPEGTSLVPPDFLALNLLSLPAGNATSACVSISFFQETRHGAIFCFLIADCSLTHWLHLLLAIFEPCLVYCKLE